MSEIMTPKIVYILVLVSSVMTQKPLPSPSFTFDEKVEATYNTTIEQLIKSLTKDPTNISSCQMQGANSFCVAASQCLTFLSSNVTTSLDNLLIDQNTFPVLCSQFLKDDTLTSSKNEVKHGKPTPSEVWGYGLLCVTIISLMSVVGVGVLPLMSKSFYSEFLTGLIGLAVGSLAGSAVFHLIPSAFNLKNVPFFPHHSYLHVALAVWAGMYLFFVIERFMKISMDAKARRDGEEVLEGHGHSHANGRTGGAAEEELLVKVSRSDTTTSLVAGFKGCGDCHYRGMGHTEDIENTGEVARKSVDFRQIPEVPHRKRCCSETITDQEKSAIDQNVKKNLVYEQSIHAVKASFGHLDKPHPETRPTVESVKKLEEGRSKIATVAWMIIFGDGLHNFIDGLSIGAAFSESLLTGVSVCIAVLCEEFPHELGDFAVLLNAGMSMKQAMCYNFLSACTCYCGFVFGVILGELDANSYIFALAGGMFLYISLVDMVPELNEIVETASREGVGKALRIFFIQNVGILIGVSSLFTLAKYQDEIQFEAV